MKRILCLLLAVMMTVALFSGCEQEEKPYIPTGDALDHGIGVTTPTQQQEKKTLSLPYYPEKTLNPYMCADYTNRTLFPLLYQGLFVTDSKGVTSPVLCKSFSVSADMRTYTFTLENAAFSDGITLTSEDVVASMNVARGESFYWGRFRHVVSVEATDPNTVVIRLDTPCENFHVLMDIPIVKASDVGEPFPIGTGPYFIQEAIAGIRLRKHPEWWCDAALPVTFPYIPLVEVESTRDIRDQFEADKIGLVCANPCSDAFADFRCDYELWDCENGVFLYLTAHMDSKIFSNDAVRSALSSSIDRDFLVRAYYRGSAHASALPAPPTSSYYDADLAADYSYDISKLTKAVEEAELVGEEVVLLVNKEDTVRLRVAKAIGQMLSQSGLKVTILETIDMYCQNYLLTGEYDLYLGQTRLSPNMDLTPFFAKEGSLNYGKLDDISMYYLGLDALANSGNYYDLYRKVMDDGRLVPILFQRYAIYAARGVITELNPARDALFYYDLGKRLEDAITHEKPVEPPTESTEPTDATAPAETQPAP